MSFRLFIFLIILNTFFRIDFANAETRQRAYIDADAGVVSVYNMPGQNWKTCSKIEGCKSVGWPDDEAKVFVLGEKIIDQTIDPYTNLPIESYYYQIKYEYKRTVDGKTYLQKGKGYIDADYVNLERKESIYKPKKIKTEEICDPKKDEKVKTNNFNEDLNNQNLDMITDEVHKHIGRCVTRKVPMNLENPYDKVVLPEVSKAVSFKISEKRLVNHVDLVAIDALARTMYGEMARCYKAGLHYPMAVARIALNRSESEPRKSEFISGPHLSSKSQLAKVVTSSDKFSVWMPSYRKNENPALRQALCPPVSADKKFWTGSQPPESELRIWRNTVKIATEAVLFPEKFKTRTNELRNRYFYTSGMRNFFNMKLVKPSIGGRSIDRESCMQIWAE